MSRPQPPTGDDAPRRDPAPDPVPDPVAEPGRDAVAEPRHDSVPTPRRDSAPEPRHDPVPASVRAELDRLAVRWTQLSYEHASSATPAVLALYDSLAARDAQLRDVTSPAPSLTSPASSPTSPAPSPSEVPPAEALDRLLAVTFDLFSAPGALPSTDQVLAELRSLRTSLPGGIAPPGAHA